MSRSLFSTFRFRLSLGLLCLACLAGLFLSPMPRAQASGNNLIFAQLKKLVASDGAPSDYFFVVGISGDTVVVGASSHNNAAGATYVFERNQGGADNWGLVKKLTASDATMGDAFGAAVGISGDTVVIGAYQNNSHRGAAYIFDRNQGGANNWGQVKKLIASDAADPDFFAAAVTINGDTVIIGAYHKQFFTGAAYVFDRNQGGAGNWGQVKKLTASDAANNDSFGGAVSLSGDTVAISALGKNGNTGAAYIFGRNQGGANNWGEIKKLTIGDAVPQDVFGSSIAISNDTVVVGAFGKNSTTGAAYVFGRNQGGANNWGQVRMLTANDGIAPDRFGLSVGIAGDMVVVGADQNYGNAGQTFRGAAYLFGRNQGGTDSWAQMQKLTANDEADYGYFGQSVGISGDTASNYKVIVGALFANDKAGASYIFRNVCNGITLSPATLPSGLTGQNYNQPLTPNGALANAANFNLSAGTLPNGVTLSSTGVLSGIPTQLGSFSFTVTATDGYGCMGMQSYTLTITCGPLTLTPNPLPFGQVNSAYSQNLTALGASGATTFSLLSGALPNGLTLLPNGLISGTPTQLGNSTFQIKALDSNGCNGTQTLTLSVNCPTISLTPTTLPNASAGVAYNQALSATPASSYSFAVTQGALPPGLTLNHATGAITGTPTASGNFAFVVTATGFGVCLGTQAYSLLVTSCTTAITLNPATLPSGTLGATYNQTLSATPTSTYNFSSAGGALPAGLSLSANTGVISGTPTQAGTFVITFKATNASGCSGTRVYVLTVACAAITITPATLPNGYAGSSYSQPLTASPASNYTYSLQTGQLPPGFSLSSAGVLSGTGAMAGTYNFTVKAQVGSCSGTRAFTLTIGMP